jgi:hypothetical protein
MYFPSPDIGNILGMQKFTLGKGMLFFKSQTCESLVHYQWCSAATSESLAAM